MSSISPNVTHQPLPYHEVSSARLPLVTSLGLQASGVPLEALGLRDGKKQVLTACFTFLTFARESMPPSLGGLDERAESRLSPASVTFLAGVTASSPAKRFSPNGSSYKPRVQPQPAANLQSIPVPVVTVLGAGLTVADQPRRGRSAGPTEAPLQPVKTPRSKSRKSSKSEASAASEDTVGG